MFWLQLKQLLELRDAAVRSSPKPPEFTLQGSSWDHGISHHCVFPKEKRSVGRNTSDRFVRGCKPVEHGANIGHAAGDHCMAVINRVDMQPYGP